MASLDALPGDQRAVLQLVLGRGRSYAEIARLLSINPEAVHERALSALDALGPQTRASDENRMAITDYLLGQLPDEALPGVRDVLAHSAAERAWAQAISAQLAPISPTALPEIPQAQSAATAPDPPQPTPVAPASAATPTPAGDPEGESPRRARRGVLRRRRGTVRDGETTAAAAAAGAAGGAEDENEAQAGERPSSRRGGMVVIGLGLVVLLVVLGLVFKHSNSAQNHPGTSSTAASAPASLTNATTGTTPGTATTTPASSTTTAAAGTTGSGKLRQINLDPPSGGSQPDAVGIADIIPQGSANEVAIVAQHITPNTKRPPNAYEVWLYNSPTDAVSLGFVNPGVGAKGKLVAAGKWPSDALHYKYLIVTVETTDAPKQPGPIILQGLTASAAS